MKLCPHGGVLVGRQGWLPVAACEHNWGSGKAHVGCNRLRCGDCGEQLTHRIGFELSDSSADPELLLRSADWATLPFLVAVPDSTARLYACACLLREEFGTTVLDPPVPDDGRRFRSAWRCAGHPLFEFPTRLAGVELRVDTDVAALVREALADRIELEISDDRSQRRPGFVSRLFVLLGDLGREAEISSAVAEALSDPDPGCRRAALDFFLEHPGAPGAGRLAAVAGERPELFADAETGSGDRELALEKALLAALDRRLALRDAAGAVLDQPALELCKAELLGAGRMPRLVLPVAAADPRWLHDNIAPVARVDTATVPYLIAAMEDLAEEDLVGGLTALHGLPGVSDDEIRQQLAFAVPDPELQRRVLSRVLGGAGP